MDPGLLDVAGFIEAEAVGGGFGAEAGVDCDDDAVGPAERLRTHPVVGKQ